MREQFQPPPHVRPDSFLNTIIYNIRLLVDFQFNSIYKHMKLFLPSLTGKVVDVGAGESPFMHLLNSAAAEYIGLDTHDAKKFGYANSRIIEFDGSHLPFEDNSVDHFICTEVLEHVEEPQQLIAEMYRVTKPGGRGVITIPWSARYHFIPHDYRRYTPTLLRKLFCKFSTFEIVERGNDLTVIASKIIVAYARLFVPVQKIELLIRLPLAALFLPVALAAIALGHASLLLKLGSVDDPLGYTVWLRK